MKQTLGKSLLTRIPPDRLGISSWVWAKRYYHGRFSLFDLPQAAADFGISRLEMNDFMLPPPRFSRVVRPLMWSIPTLPRDTWRYRPASFTQLAEKMAETGTRAVCWTLNSNFVLPNSHQPTQNYYRSRGIEACRRLGIPNLRIILGGRHKLNLAQAAEIELISDRLVDFIRSTLERVPGLQLLLENHWGVATDIDYMLTIFRATTEKLSREEANRFGLCLDATNMPIKVDRTTYWAKMAPYARHVHLKAKDQDSNPIDLNPLLDILADVNYSGLYILEDGHFLDHLSDMR